jgi:hypothetical protein
VPLEQLAVDIECGPNNLLGSERRLRQATRLATQALSQIAVLDQALQCARKTVHISWRNQQTSIIVLHNFAASRYVGRYDRSSCRCRLNQHLWDPFAIVGREAHNMDGTQQGTHVGNMTEP